jgi:hypothetical protein
LGPLNDKELGSYTATYHKSKLVCCGLPRHDQTAADKRVKGQMDVCIYAVHKDELFTEQQKDKFKYYSFTSINEYLSSFVSPLFLGQFRCISFTWAPTFDNATFHIKDMHQASYSFTPAAVITNIGLHETERGQEIDTLLNTMIKATDETFDSHKTIYIMHSATHVNEDAPDFKFTLRNDRILRVIDIIRNKLNTWRSLNHRYMDLYNLTTALHQIPGCYRPDGIHFEARCVYQALVTQWDFNWLRSTGAIQVSS